MRARTEVDVRVGLGHGRGGRGQFGEASVPQLSERVRKSLRCRLLLGRGGCFTPEVSAKGNSWD